MRHVFNELMIPEEVAELLGVAPTVLREMRKTGSGVPFIRFSPRGHSRYRYDDVVRWMVEAIERLKAEGDARQVAWEHERLIAARKHLQLVRRKKR